MLHRPVFVSIVAVLAFGPVSRAEVVNENGMTYDVSRRIEQRPVSETRIEERPYTVYCERVNTEYHQTARTVYTPVTEYQWEPYLANRWNPFTSPNVAYRYIPKTRWEMRNEEVQVPVTRRELVAEQRVSRVPVVSQRFVPVEHITKVPVGNSLAGAAKPIGGVATMQSDPPRQGDAWQSNDSALMRR